LFLWSIILTGIDQNAGISRGGQESIMSHVLTYDIQCFWLIFLWGWSPACQEFPILFTELCKLSRNVPIYNKCFLQFVQWMSPTSSYLCLGDLAISKSRTIQKKYGTFFTSRENVFPKASEWWVLR
jgi:hypothetical protein